MSKKGMLAKSMRPKFFTTFFGLLMLFPFLWMVSSSLKNSVEAFATPPTLLPKEPTLENYRNVFRLLDMPRLFLNSIVVSLVCVFLQLATSALAGYAFARLQFRAKNAIFLVYLATMMIPFQVIIVPLFIGMRQFGLIDSYLGLGLPMIASAFGVFLMRQAMLAIPRELEEAAILDGANHFRLFFSVALPLCIPTLAALGILSFMSVWNAYLWPLVIIFSPEKMTLPLALSNLHGENLTDWPMVMAATTIATLPIAIVYLILQKQIAQSFLTAGLKG
ncbi:MAG: carbohydrate ABC transporter permease [Candidatus Nanopelagicaceae bacterium]|nr:carbohydrate ABC transporter permease [Candidatus Nanopelagicaceae bacterium]